jgi:hypothetical protein
VPTWGVLVVRLRERPDCRDLDCWRRDFLNEFGTDVVGCGGTLRIVRDAGDGPVPLDDGSIWLDLGLTLCYYGEGYERGDPEQFARIADWLERRIRECEVWYGHDISDESIKPFGSAERAALLTYFRRVGHEPYYRP